jgi:type IV pilus assembly protein PilX
MSKIVMPSRSSQRGMALVAALLLLLVITILGVGMFHSFGIQERIAGNTREKHRALHAAETAEVHVETALKGNQGANATTGVACTAGVVAETPPAIQVCTNTLATVATNMSTLPLNIGGQAAGVTYTPPGITVGTDSSNVYFALPSYYVSFIAGLYNQQTGVSTNTYTIDALGYGGTANSMAEVESTYVVNVAYTTQCPTCKSKFINLGGP